MMNIPLTTVAATTSTPSFSAQLSPKYSQEKQVAILFYRKSIKPPPNFHVSKQSPRKCSPPKSNQPLQTIPQFPQQHPQVQSPKPPDQTNKPPQVQSQLRPPSPPEDPPTTCVAFTQIDIGNESMQHELPAFETSLSLPATATATTPVGNIPDRTTSPLTKTHNITQENLELQRRPLSSQNYSMKQSTSAGKRLKLKGEFNIAHYNSTRQNLGIYSARFIRSPHAIIVSPNQNKQRNHQEKSPNTSNRPLSSKKSTSNNPSLQLIPNNSIPDTQSQVINPTTTPSAVLSPQQETLTSQLFSSQTVLKNPTKKEKHFNHQESPSISNNEYCLKQRKPNQQQTSTPQSKEQQQKTASGNNTLFHHLKPREAGPAFSLERQVGLLQKKLPKEVIVLHNRSNSRSPTSKQGDSLSISTSSLFDASPRVKRVSLHFDHFTHFEPAHSTQQQNRISSRNLIKNSIVRPSTGTIRPQANSSTNISQIINSSRRSSEGNHSIIHPIQIQTRGASPYNINEMISLPDEQNISNSLLLPPKLMPVTPPPPQAQILRLNHSEYYSKYIEPQIQNRIRPTPQNLQQQQQQQQQQQPPQQQYFQQQQQLLLLQSTQLQFPESSSPLESEHHLFQNPAISSKIAQIPQITQSDSPQLRSPISHLHSHPHNQTFSNSFCDKHLIPKWNSTLRKANREFDSLIHQSESSPSQSQSLIDLLLSKFPSTNQRKSPYLDSSIANTSQQSIPIPANLTQHQDIDSKAEVDDSIDSSQQQSSVASSIQSPEKIEYLNHSRINLNDNSEIPLLNNQETKQQKRYSEYQSSLKNPLLTNEDSKYQDHTLNHQQINPLKQTNTPTSDRKIVVVLRMPPKQKEQDQKPHHSQTDTREHHTNADDNQQHQPSLEPLETQNELEFSSIDSDQFQNTPKPVPTLTPQPKNYRFPGVTTLQFINNFNNNRGTATITTGQSSPTATAITTSRQQQQQQHIHQNESEPSRTNTNSPCKFHGNKIHQYTQFKYPLPNQHPTSVQSVIQLSRTSTPYKEAKSRNKTPIDQTSNNSKQEYTNSLQSDPNRQQQQQQQQQPKRSSKFFKQPDSNSNLNQTEIKQTNFK